MGVATDKDSQRTYITYTKSYIIFSTSGVLLCERQGDGHVCREVDVTPSDEIAAFVAAPPPAQAGFDGSAIAGATPRGQSEPPRTKAPLPLPVKADKPTGELVFDTEDALATATVTLPSWCGSNVVVHLKDGRQIEGELSLVNGLDVRVRTETSTWSGSLTEVERLVRY